MSSFMAVCQSFLKEKGVSYYTEGGKIAFPCIDCQAMAIMNTEDTSWRCADGHAGNLKSLIRMSERGVELRGEVYNPRKAQTRLHKSFEKLLVKYRDAGLRRELEELRKQVDQLVDHLSHGGAEKS